MSIKTPEDWWTLFDALYARKSFEEIASNIYGTAPHFSVTTKMLGVAKDLRNHDIAVEVLNTMWNDAPDKPYIHEWRDWGNLCNLCSECWVFNPEEPNEHI